MERLEPAQWIKIFDFLDVNDLMRCSQVSRTWRSTVLERTEITSLSCKQKVGRFHRLRYSFNFESVENDRVLLADDLRCLQSEPLRTMLQESLKKLYIHHSTECIAKKKSSGLIQALNQFTKLEQLQINALHMSSTEELTLPNLMCLTVSNFIGYGRLTLNTPKLTSFSTGDFDMYEYDEPGKLSNFKFEYPSRIVCMDVENYESGLTNFANLEILYCRSFYDKTNMLSTNDFLAALPKLKELQSSFIKADLVCQFLSSKCKLRRISFHFYFCGFRIDSINELEEYFNFDEEYTSHELQWCENSFETMLSNPRKVSQYIPFVSQILVYGEMVPLFDRISFASFFSRFVKFEEVEIKRPEQPYDESKLVEFLKACKFIGDLSTEESSLSQSLFDQLPVHQPYITRLTIYNETELNLEFIFKFRYLKIFLTNQKVSISFVSRAFRDLPLLSSFYTFSSNKRFEFRRDSILEGWGENTLEFKGNRPMVSFLEDLISSLA